MKKAMLLFTIFIIFLPRISVAQTTDDKSQANKKATIESISEIQKWGEATLIIKDDKGNVILNRTEKYPNADPAKVNADSNQKYDPANWNENCWNWCRKVCDGYGVCWVSCGLSCSPWTK